MSYWNAMPTNDVIATAAITSFMVVVALFVLHSRFVWWPIHPMGFLLSGGQFAMWTRAVFEVHKMIGSIWFRGPLGIGFDIKWTQRWKI